MKKVLIKIVVGIICFMSGAVATKYNIDLIKLIPSWVLVCTGIFSFIILIGFFLYKCLKMFPDVYSDNDEGGMYK